MSAYIDIYISHKSKKQIMKGEKEQNVSEAKDKNKSLSLTMKTAWCQEKQSA